MFVRRNKYTSSTSLVSLNGYNIEGYHKQDIVTNIKFEEIIPSTQKNLFHQRIMDSIKKLELSDQKYQSNVIVRDENNNGNFLFPMKEFL